MRPIDTIVIHCSATKEGVDLDVNDIRKMHLKRGFNDVGYHFVITLDGKVQKGRPLSVIGAHAFKFNKTSIGICYIGGLSKMGVPKDTRTQEQLIALADLLRDLIQEVGTIKKIVGHRDLSPDLNGDGEIDEWEWVKVCPCFDVDEFIEYLGIKEML